MSSKILILGAAGFIGRHLAERMAAQGKEVFAATRSPATFNHPRICNIVASYEHASDFGPLVEQADAVIHAASSTTPGSTAAKPQLEGNLRTTLALIEALQAAPECRVLFLSSAGTLYGDRDRPAREDDALRPRSYHGAGKAAAEFFLQAWTTQFSGTAVVIRPSNVYGPGQSAGKGFGIIPAALECALHGRPLTIWGDGSNVRDYLFVEDFVALCERALAATFDPGAHVFNAAYGEGLTLTALLDRIDAVTRRPVQRVHAPARAVDVHSITVDGEAARSRLEWQPSISVEEGLRRTWQWFSTRA